MVVDYGAFQQPPSRALPRLPDGRAARPALLRRRRAGTSDALPRSADRTLRRPARARGRLAEALVRQQEAPGRRRGGPARPASSRDGRATARRDRPAGRCCSAARSSSSTRRWPRSRSRRVLEARRGAPVVPVFWVRLRRPRLRRGPLHHRARRGRADPHAALRARSASRSASPRRASSSTRRSPASSRSWAGRCPPGLHRDAVLELLARVLPPRRHRSSDAFARLLSALLPDLVVLDPSDPALKALHGARAVARGRARARPPRGWPRRPAQRAARRRLPPAGAGAARLPEPLRA